MAVLNLKSIGLTSTAGLIGSAKAWLDTWQTEPKAEGTTRTQTAEPDFRESLSPDQERYARILDTELDRDLLSKVEREDSEMLARVRDALYADD